MQRAGGPSTVIGPLAYTHGGCRSRGAQRAVRSAQLFDTSRGGVIFTCPCSAIPLPTLQKAYEARQLQVQILATCEGPMAVAQARIGEGVAIEAARSQ